MADLLHLEVITPSGVALREPATEVTVPTLGGQIGLLAGHVPLLAAVRTGILTTQHQGVDKRLAIFQGFVQVTADKIVVLTEKMGKQDDVDIVATRSRLKEVDEALDRWQAELSDPRRTELIEEEQWLATLLELMNDPPPPVVREDTRYVQKGDLPIPADELERHSKSDVSLTDTPDP